MDDGHITAKEFADGLAKAINSFPRAKDIERSFCCHDWAEITKTKDTVRSFLCLKCNKVRYEEVLRSGAYRNVRTQKYRSRLKGFMPM